MNDIHKDSLRVLMVGKGYAYHVEPLAQCIKIACSKIQLEIQGLQETKTDGTRNYPKSSPVFDAVHQFPWSIDGQRPKYKSLKKKAIKQKFQPIWMQCARLFFRSISFGKYLKYDRYFASLISEVDVIHLQSLFYTPALRWLLSNRNIPIVASCLGSDVLRESNILRTLTQQQLLRLASAITVTGSEFKEIVLSKYGRELSSKIHETFFDPQIERFSNSSRTEASKRFRNCLSVPLGSFIVCIGHNGYPEGQHLDLIKSIAAIEKSKKDSLFFVVPMTYGASNDYQELVSQMLYEAGLFGIVLKEFLPEGELKDLRLATDILIYAPVSDAFSASVSQALAAGSAAILGSWLPYKARQRAGFEYWEIDTPAEAGQMLEHILESWPEAQFQSEPNRKLSAEFFSQERIGQQWINVYESAIQRFKENS